MSEDNYIYSYYQAIKSGKIIVGKWILKIYEYIIKGLENKEFFYDQKKGNGAVDWIEAHCYHTEGALAPGNFKLELWQKAMVSAIFGIVDENGLRQFREALLVIGRKNGKSILASSIAKYVWMVEGGYGAKIYTIAPKLDQADIIYNNIWQQVVVDPDYKELQKRLDELRGKRQGDAHARRFIEEMPRHRQSDLYLPINNGTVKKIAFSSKRSDGFNPSLTICDEIGSGWIGDQGIKQYSVMKSGMGARQESLLMSLSTAGYLNDGIFDELMKRSTRFLLGDSKERKLLPFLYIIDDPDKWNDVNELRKSNPNLGVSIPVDYMLEEIAVAEGSLAQKSEFMCKYCNLKQNSSLAWLDAQEVEKCCGEPLRLEDFRSSYAVVGIDLSQSVDLTAVSCLIEKDGIINVFAHFFLPSEKIEEATARDGVPYMAYVKRGFLTLSGENFVDYHDCYRWIIDLIEKYEIYPLKCGYDKWSATYLIQDLKSAGVHCDDVYQGDNLWGIIQEVGALIKDKKVRIGDNDLLKAHFLNSAIKMNNDRGRGRLIKINPNAHIDGMASVLDAFTMRSKYHDEIGEQLHNGTF